MSEHIGQVSKFGKFVNRTPSQGTLDVEISLVKGIIFKILV